MGRVPGSESTRMVSLYHLPKLRFAQTQGEAPGATCSELR